jgi:phosphoribosylanthranilate isomerase
MWVKICANTCVEDAVKAAELGADAVGFVFAPSKRQVTAEQVRLIAAELPVGVERVGVFGDLSAEEIARAAETARLTAAQLHGGFDEALSKRLEELLAPEVSLIQTVHVPLGDSWRGDRRDDVHASLELVRLKAPSGRVLLDTKVGSGSGGTGISYDWRSVADSLAGHPGLRVIAAGGLNPHNVGEAIGTLRPWGVDVASGVEREPGRKDFAKLKAFIENARGAC